MSEVLPFTPKTRSGTERRQRSIVLTVRVNAAERAEIEAQAERMGVTVGTYMRACCLVAPTTRATRRPPVEKAALAQLIGQIGKVGSNINQIARNENRSRDDAWMPDALREGLADLKEMKEALMQKLGYGAR